MGRRKIKQGLIVSARGKDSAFLHEDGSVVFVIELLADSKLECEVIKEQHTSEFFTNPCSSKLFDIQFIRKECHFKRRVIDKSKLLRKLVCIPYSGGRVICPLLHGSEVSKAY